MDHDPSSLLAALSSGDDQAAKIVFDRYVGRLIGLARKRLSARLSQRLDPEDVVQSAFRSFFRKAGKGEFVVDDPGDLWRLLVVITLNKLRRNVEHHTAAKRNMGRESAQSDDDQGDQGPTANVQGRVDAPDAAIEIHEELVLLMHDFSEEQRRIVELRLQGYQIEEIASDVSKSERTVRRTMERLKQRLTERAAGIVDDES